MSDIPDNTFALNPSFTIGNKAYLINIKCNNELWEYNPVNDSWAKKADFPGTCRLYASGFAVNGKGYVGLGRDQQTQNQLLTDFWQYDPVTNTWTQKAQFPGPGRDVAVGFSIGNKGYLGTGIAPLAQSTFTYYNDFWEYNPGSDTWTQKANVPGLGRGYAVGISLNGNGYVGLGNSDYPNNDLGDFYEYNQASDTWTQKSNIPVTEARAYAASFTINSDIYVTGGLRFTATGTKAFNNCLRFDVLNDSWTYDSDFGGLKAFGQMAVTFSNTAYVGAGLPGDAGGEPLTEWWKFEINTTDLHKYGAENLSFECYPNPATNSLHLKMSNSVHEIRLKLLSIDGIIVMDRKITSPEETIDISLLPPGLFIAELSDRGSILRKTLVKE